MNRDKRVVNYLQSILHFLYSIPSFFIGALLIFIFANPYQSQLLPANFSFAPLIDNGSFTFVSLMKSWTFFILPIVTLSFGAIVFLP